MKKVSVFMPTLASVASVGVASSKDDVAPVITQVALTREGDALRAMATDRYVVVTGRYTEVEFTDWEDGETILVRPVALSNAVKLVPKKNHKHTLVEISVDDGDTVWISDGHNRTTANSPLIKGSFPPVMKLFKREVEPNGAPVLNLRTDFLAKLSRVLPPEVSPDRNRTWEFRFFSESDRPNKPNPVYAKYAQEGGTYELEALIQPALMRK